MSLIELSKHFKKLCLANTKDNLSRLLAQALATADRDAYLVFLDLLEEVNPQVKKALSKPGLSLIDMLNFLEEAVPTVIRYYQDNTWSIQVPTFGEFNRVGHDGGRVVCYNQEFEVNFDYKELTGNVYFFKPPVLKYDGNNIEVKRIIKTRHMFEVILVEGPSFISYGGHGISTICGSCINKANDDYNKLKDLLTAPKAIKS